MVKKQVVLRTDDGDNDMFRTPYVARRRSIRIPRHRQKLMGAVKELYKLRRCVSKGHHKDGFADCDGRGYSEGKTCWLAEGKTILRAELSFKNN